VVEDLLNSHILSRRHYRELFGRDVSNLELETRTKEHLKTVILALVNAESTAGIG
jgi:hypothetical protein